MQITSRNQRYAVTPDDFRSGRYDDIFQVINAIDLVGSDIVPVEVGILSQQQIRKAVARLPQYPLIINKWQGVVNANDLSVIVNISDNKAESTKTRKKQLQNRTYSFLYTQQKLRSIELQVVELLGREGNAIVRFNSEGKLVVDSRFQYKIYWNEETKECRYEYLKNGRTVEGMKNLKHGVEIYHIKHPAYEAWPIALSPVENALLYLKLEFHGITVNQKIFDQGMVGQIFLQLQKEILPDVKKSLAEDAADKPSWFSKLMRQMNDKLAGSRKANQVSFMPGLEGILEVGKDNKSMQFFEMLDVLTPSRIAWAWSLVPADLGTGGAQTQNNVSIFDDSLFDKIGRHINRALAEMINEFVLPFTGLKTSESFYVQYNSPEDPKKVEEHKQAREDYINNGITLNEFREKIGLPTLENGDKFLFELSVPSLPPSQDQQFQVVDAVVQPKRGYREGSPDFFVQARAYRATNVDKALDSDEYEMFLKRFTKAVKKQITEYTESIESLDKAPETVELKPLETFYSFPALKKDLLKFAGIALETVKKDKRTTFNLKRDYFDGEYPQSVLDWIDQQVERILKGDKDFKSVDVETASQIESIIKLNISDGVFQIAKKIVEKVDTISLNRAELIAQTEVANAVEGTREIMYTTDPIFENGWKRWLTSNDELVRPQHKENEKQGLIKIDELFQNGYSRAGTEPRCRCDVLYYTADEV